VTGAAIKAISSGTIATTRVPGFLSFWTGTDAAPTVLTERMRIDNAGNVGVGVTGPIFKLDVSTSNLSVAKFHTTTTGNTSNIDISNASNFNYGSVGVVSGTGLAAGDIFGLGYTSNSNNTFTPVLNWTSGGSVGIGTTTTPDAFLHVNAALSSSNNAFKMTDTAAAAGYFKVTDGTSVAGNFIPTLWSKGVGTGNPDRYGIQIIAEPGEDGSDDGAVKIQGELNGSALVNDDSRQTMGNRSADNPARSFNYSTDIFFRWSKHNN